MVLFGMGLSELNSWGSLREGHIRMGLNGVNRFEHPVDCAKIVFKTRFLLTELNFEYP